MANSYKGILHYIELMRQTEKDSFLNIMLRMFYKGKELLLFDFCKYAELIPHVVCMNMRAVLYKYKF